MFNGLVKKLKAIPATGVAQIVNYSTKGCVERLYRQICIQVLQKDDDKILLAFTPAAWEAAKKLAQTRQFDTLHPDVELGRVIKHFIEVKICNKSSTSTFICFKAELDDEQVVVALRPSEYARAIEQGKKVSSQHNFHVSWFKRVIRRAGLFIFG